MNSSSTNPTTARGQRPNPHKFNNKKESQYGEDLFKYRLEVGYNDRKRQKKEQGDARILRKKQVR